MRVDTVSVMCSDTLVLWSMENNYNVDFVPFFEVILLITYYVVFSV